MISSFYIISYPLQEFIYEETSLSRCRERKGSALSPWFKVCGQDNVFAPENFFQVEVNKDLSKSGVIKGSGGSGFGSAGGASGSGEQVIQMKPQKASMRLRVRKFSL